MHIVFSELVSLLQDLILSDKALQWPDQVQIDVIAIVGHEGRRQEGARPETSLLELECLLDRDKGVFLAVHYEGRASDPMHLAQIVELLG